MTDDEAMPRDQALMAIYDRVKAMADYTVRKGSNDVTPVLVEKHAVLQLIQQFLN